MVFDAVLHQRSAMGATQLNMTQPAISQALSRLRGAVKDELFVRTPDGMEPTPYALQLAAPVRRALVELGVALDGAAAFEPSEAAQEFTVALDNHSALVIAAPFAAAVAAEAPGVRLDLRPSGTMDVAGRLDRGELDLAIGWLAAPGGRFADLRLLEDGFTAVLRQGHPEAGAGPALSIAALARLPHLVISSTGEETGFVDEALAQQGLKRRVALRVPLLAVGAVLAQSDMVAVMTDQAAREFACRAPLLMLQLPFPTPRLTTALLWHRRLTDQAPHCWLRGLVARTARAL